MACNLFRQAEDYRQRALETDSDKGKRRSHGPEHDLGEQRLGNETASLNCENKKRVCYVGEQPHRIHTYLCYIVLMHTQFKHSYAHKNTFYNHVFLFSSSHSVSVCMHVYVYTFYPSKIHKSIHKNIKQPKIFKTDYNNKC